MKFNITRIVPDGFMHTQAFLEVIESLSWSLASLGHEVNCTQNWLSEHGETNIVFGTEVMADFQKLPQNTIVFNLEQSSHPNMEKVRRLSKGCTIWDFSRQNVEEWKRLGYDVKHVPIGFTPNLTRIPKAETYTWDVCFFGWMTPRRLQIIEQLRAAGLKVYASAACYGGGRDNIISRSKICLNVHHDGRDMFEIVRVSYLMANSKCVVSEESVDDGEYRDLLVPRCNYRGLVDMCKTICKLESQPAMGGDAALASIRKRDFTQSVAAALDEEPISRYYQMPDTRQVDGTSLRLSNIQVPYAAVPDPIPTMGPILGINRSAWLKGGGATSPINIVPTGGSPSGERVSAGVTPEGAVLVRYQRGKVEGDMKDFLPWMRSQAKGNIMEIGVRDGASTSAFLLGLEEHGGYLYSVDVQDCSHLFLGHPRWHFIQANSTAFQEVIKHIPYELDILLIDGDHSRAGVISDFQYARQLRPGGMVLFHDIAPEERPPGCTDMSWPGDAAKEVFEEFAAALAPLGWTKEILPGRYGLGVLRKPS